MTKDLTVKRIENANAKPARQEIPDGLLVGLYLIVQPSGAKSFAVRYRYAGQPRKLTLGAFPAITLEAARDIGGKALRAAAEGRDTATERQAADRAPIMERPQSAGHHQARRYCTARYRPRPSARNGKPKSGSGAKAVQ